MRYLFILLISLAPYSAKALKEEAELNFVIQTQKLLEGEIQYSFSVLSAANVRKNYPLVAELDSLDLLGQKNASIMLSKFAFVAKAPLGAFDHKEDEEAAYLASLTGSTVRRVGEARYSVTTKGAPELRYTLARFEDSDDISTLSRSKAARGIQAAKRLDPLFQSSSLMIFHELTGFSHSYNGGTELYSYLPLNEHRTLVFGMKFVSLKDYSNGSSLRQGLTDELEGMKRILDAKKPLP